VNFFIYEKKNYINFDYLFLNIGLIYVFHTTFTF